MMTLSPSAFLSFIFKYIYFIYMYMSASIYIPTDNHGGQKASNLLELEIQEVNYMIWVMGSKSESSGRAVCFLDCQFITPPCVFR